MKREVSITSSNCVETLHTLSYGVNIISYETQESKEKFHEIMNTYNKFCGSIPLYERPHLLSIIVEGEWVDKIVADKFEIISSLDSIVALDPINYQLKNIASRAKETACEIWLEGLDQKLHKYAKEIAKNYNVKFTGMSFNGSVPSLSVRKQLEEAYFNKKDEVLLPKSNYNILSVRNMCSAYGQAIGKKFNVTMSDEFIVISLNQNSSLEQRILKLLDELDFSDEKIMLLNKLKKRFIYVEDDEDDNDDQEVSHPFHGWDD